MKEPRRAEIIVEGDGDQHFISNLLWKCSIENYRISRKAEDIKVVSRPETVLISEAGSREKLLRLMSTRIKAGNHSALGFVIDADVNLPNESAIQRTWSSIRHRAEQGGLTVPSELHENGVVVGDIRSEMCVGFWVMPNNRDPGAIEEFLRQVIEKNDPLIGFAETCTREAKARHPDAFADSAFSKAHLACWLAWHPEPGRPYGQAILHDYFRKDMELCKRFIDWVQLLIQPTLEEAPE